MANESDWLAPASTREVVSDATQVSNLLLRLYHYLPKSLMTVRERKNPELREIAKAAPRLLDATLLRELAKRRRELLAQLAPLGYRPLPNTRLKLVSNLTCGLSTPNLVERGMALLRPYGVPLLPGSAVKGAIAAHLAEVLESKLHLDDEERDRALASAGLRALFGYGPVDDKPGKASDVVFLDALPESGTLRVDITTPHHARYYQGEEQAAAGFEMPNPLPFLTVAAGAVFHFPIAVKAGAQWGAPGPAEQERLRVFEITHFETLEAFLEDALASTGMYKGFGAQTNVGYGRFERFRPAPA
jgi:CRISPR-associated protein Cmr6